MKHSVTVREYAKLTTSAVEPTLDISTITESAFDWLCKQAAGRASGARLVQVQDRRCLRLDNYVGVIETPCGTRIEILPKHAEADVDLESLRLLMMRMITCALDLPVRQNDPAAIRAVRQPASEWLMANFLAELDALIKRGARFEYVRIDEQQRFLQGQLDIAQQVRRPPGKQHYLHVRHDIYTPDRPENRLLRSALDKVRRLTRQSDNWRLARELAVYFDSIPRSSDYHSDFRSWRHERLTGHYQTVRPWCQLLLEDQNPLSQVGEWRGMSMLFPMQGLFERFVAKCLSTSLAGGWRIATQVRSQYLCRHLNSELFQLQPDIKIYRSDEVVILDTKWKLLDERISLNDKYGLGQQDLYQIFAYGQKYLQGRGELFLIYPLTTKLRRPLSAFNFTDELRLWVVPFDLEEERLVVGPWCAAASWLNASQASFINTEKSNALVSADQLL